jgi:hypothetical protein
VEIEAQASQSGRPRRLHVSAIVAAPTAVAATWEDLRFPDTRDAARGITTGSVPAPAPLAVERRTVVTVDESSSQTLAIVFSACALLIPLMSVGFVAMARRPRARWTAS